MDSFDLKKYLAEGRLNEETSNSLRDELIDMGKGICSTNGFLNCQLFAQLVSDETEILKLPQVKDMQIGDILVWGRWEDNPPRHYSIFIGNGEVMEVEGWGEKMRIISFEDVNNEYEGMLEIFRPNYNK